MLQCKFYSAERFFLHIQGTCDCEPLPLAEIHILITFLIQDFNCYLHRGCYVTAGHYLSICEKKNQVKCSKMYFKEILIKYWARK